MQMGISLFVCLFVCLQAFDISFQCVHWGFEEVAFMMI